MTESWTNRGTRNRFMIGLLSVCFKCCTHIYLMYSHVLSVYGRYFTAASETGSSFSSQRPQCKNSVQLKSQVMLRRLRSESENRLPPKFGTHFQAILRFSGPESGLHFRTDSNFHQCVIFFYKWVKSQCCLKCPSSNNWLVKSSKFQARYNHKPRFNVIDEDSGGHWIRQPSLSKKMSIAMGQNIPYAYIDMSSKMGWLNPIMINLFNFDPHPVMLVDTLAFMEAHTHVIW